MLSTAKEGWGTCGPPDVEEEKEEEEEGKKRGLYFYSASSYKIYIYATCKISAKMKKNTASNITAKIHQRNSSTEWSSAKQIIKTVSLFS